MSLIIIGINHKTAPIEVRERFSFTKKRIDESLVKLKDSNFISGAVILSTCNRAEVYIHTEGCYSEDEDVKQFIFGLFNATAFEIKRYFYALKDLDAVRHLVRVTSGLDSQVLGETQILAQVKAAWDIAKNRGATSYVLDELFRLAQRLAGFIRTNTKISQGRTSIGSVAIKMLEDNFENLQD